MVDQIHKFGIRPFRSLIVVIRLVGSSRESSFVMNPRKMSTTVQRKKPWLIAVGDGKAKATSIVPPRLSAGGARRRSAALLDPIVACLCMSKNPSGRQSAHWSERQHTSAPGEIVTGSKVCLPTQTAHATRACKTTPPVERERAVLIGSHCPELETPGAILCATAAHTTNEGRVMKDEYK